MFVIIWTGGYISWKFGFDKLQVNSQQQLDQFVSHLDARLARFQFIPQLISKNMILVELLKQPDSSPRIDLVNHFLEDINNIIGASDTYLMNAQGLTLAASNWQEEQTFNNRNFNFRPYFIEAMKGKLGRYFALGSTSGERGYYFAYPIIYASQNLGVIVVKMDLANIESNWSNRKIQFIVSDPEGITFITTQPSWLYQSIKPLSTETLQQIHQSKRYMGVKIKIMDINILRSISSNSNIIRINNGTEKSNNEYFTIQKNISHAGWDVMIMAPLSELRKNQLNTTIVLFLIIILFTLIFFLVRQRLKRQHEREHFQQEAQKQLEHQVSVRTTDLMHEIDERKRTEQMLRETQDELIQTAKLAVLGQMSASISHELNNPLAAIHSYTDNARKFLSLNKYIQVDENLCRIVQLTKRMSKISSQLKFFSRKSSQHMEIVTIQKVIESAIEIVSHKYKKSNSVIQIQSHIADLKTRADIIQLEQILINLINNAMQAIENLNHGKVIIHIERLNQWALIHVDDNGQGIELKNIDKIFDPFFTTKKTGLGLGLSISARIMDIMNGRLSACNLPTGGARFTISLLVAEYEA
ncbi:MAG: ATP-binding protein [Gammaproteobacteria bacterium]|nr:ATP-binding protein [Gammaproteobacteria bacterium]